MHDELAKMIDEHGLEGVLRELAGICDENAELTEDAIAEDWETAAAIVETAADELDDETNLP